MTAVMIDQFVLQDFARAKSKALWRDRLSKLTRKSNDLLSFQETYHQTGAKRQHYLGLQAVSIKKIVGSEGRPLDFDRSFFPRESHTRSRWLSIDRAYYEHALLPPVELIKVGDKYFVRDGNHRVSVARSRGQEFIDAIVIEVT
jgi:hypothetical protein